MAYLDLYILDANGSLLDACLLAALGALLDLRIPEVSVTDAGNIERSAAAGAGAASRRLEIPCLPVCLTCGLYAPPAAAGSSAAAPNGAGANGGSQSAKAAVRGHGGTQLILDPTREEEGLMGALLHVAVDERQRVLGAVKAGGGLGAPPALLAGCVAAAQARHSEVVALLQSARQQAMGG